MIGTLVQQTAEAEGVTNAQAFRVLRKSHPAIDEYLRESYPKKTAVELAEEFGVVRETMRRVIKDIGGDRFKVNLEESRATGWIDNWASRMRHTPQSEERRQQLDEEGFVWNLLEARWENYLRESKTKLWQDSWARNQRYLRNRGGYPAHRIERLDEEGFVWGTARVKDHCPKGHPWDEANTQTSADGSRRWCRACRRDARLRRAAAK